MRMVEGGTCSECSKSLGGWHSAAKKTCSPACRKHRQRRIDRMPVNWLDVMTGLNLMRTDIKRRENIDLYIEQLKYLKVEINDLLLLAGDKDAQEKVQMVSDMKRRRS
jgi:hypothetical protein